MVCYGLSKCVPATHTDFAESLYTKPSDMCTCRLTLHIAFCSTMSTPPQSSPLTPDEVMAVVPQPSSNNDSTNHSLLYPRFPTMQPVVVTYQGAQCGEFTQLMESSPSRLAVLDDSATRPAVRSGNQKKISVKKEGGSNGKRKAKAGKPFESKRMKWNNDMIARLLQLRFKEGEVKRRLDSADTKTKISLAWQNLASILSQDLEKVISREQAYQKYRKLKSMYMKEKRDSKKTGNDCSIQVLDEPLWAILNDAFAKKEGISGDVLADTTVDSDEDASDKETGLSESNNGPSPGKLPPITQLAHAMENGMTAIATAMGTRPSSDDNFRALTAALEKQTHAIDEQRREARHLQELQLQLLQRLLEKKD